MTDWRGLAEEHKRRAVEAEDEVKRLQAEIERLEAEISGPDGFATWKDAAVHERVTRIKQAQEIEALKDGAERAALKGIEMRREIDRLRYALRRAADEPNIDTARAIADEVLAHFRSELKRMEALEEKHE
jgi:hypothetical protein